MNSRNIVIFCFLLFSSSLTLAQDCAIDVKTEVVAPSAGKSNGSISFQVEGQTGSKDYLIYCLTTIRKDDNTESAYHFRDLKAGIYEFVVVDKKKTKCTKEVQVKIKEQ